MLHMETKSCIGNSVLISRKEFEASRTTSALTEAERLTENYINSEVMQGNDEELVQEGDKVSRCFCINLVFTLFYPPFFPSLRPSQFFNYIQMTR